MSGNTDGIDAFKKRWSQTLRRVTEAIVVIIVGTTFTGLFGINSIPSIFDVSGSDTSATEAPSTDPDQEGIGETTHSSAATSSSPTSSSSPSAMSGGATSRPQTDRTTSSTSKPRSTTTSIPKVDGPVSLTLNTETTWAATDTITMSSWSSVNLPTGNLDAWFLNGGPAPTAITSADRVATEGESCSKDSTRILFTAGGFCWVKVFWSERAADFRRFKVTVEETPLTDLAARNGWKRNNYLGSSRGYMAHGNEVGANRKAGDVAKIWRLRLELTMPTDLPGISCTKVYARYYIVGRGAGDSSVASGSYPKDCSGAQAGIPWTTCVMFEPKYVVSNGNVSVYENANPLANVGFSYMGWAVEWKTGSSTTDSHRQQQLSVRVTEITPGTCS